MSNHFDQEKTGENLSFGFKVLAFLIPLAGAIMYFNHKSSNPQKAQSACYAALWGMGLGFLLNLLAAFAAG